MNPLCKLLFGIVLLTGAEAQPQPATSAALAPSGDVKGGSGHDRPVPSKRSNARAEARANAKAEVTKAQVEFQLGRYDRALEGYTRAYELYPAPALLFNLGQCHRNLKNYERAISFFEGYLRQSPRLDKEQRTLTAGLIAEAKVGLEREQAEAREAAAAVAARGAAPPSPVPGPDPPAPRPVALLAGDQVSSQASPHRSIARRWWFWTAIGVSAAGGVAAAYYLTGDPRRVPPASSVGTLDGR